MEPTMSVDIRKYTHRPAITQNRRPTDNEAARGRRVIRNRLGHVYCPNCGTHFKQPVEIQVMLPAPCGCNWVREGAFIVAMTPPHKRGQWEDDSIPKRVATEYHRHEH
jgi:hypothetical protein